MNINFFLIFFLMTSFLVGNPPSKKKIKILNKTNGSAQGTPVNFIDKDLEKYIKANLPQGAKYSKLTADMTYHLFTAGIMEINPLCNGDCSEEACDDILKDAKKYSDIMVDAYNDFIKKVAKRYNKKIPELKLKILEATKKITSLKSQISKIERDTDMVILAIIKESEKINRLEKSEIFSKKIKKMKKVKK